MKKIILFLAFACISFSSFSQKTSVVNNGVNNGVMAGRDVKIDAKDTIATKDSLPQLKQDDAFITAKDIADLEAALKQVLVHPEYAKLGAIDQYNMAIQPVITALVNRAYKEWLKKQQSK